jgi:hypothetical protein
LTVLAAVLLAAVVGCESEPSGLESLPSLPQVASRHPRPMNIPQPSGSKRRARITVKELALPIHLSTEKAWELIDSSVFPELTRQGWRANGMRIGVIAKSDLAKLQEALPPVLNFRRNVVYASSHPTAMLEASRQREPIQVDLSMVTSGGGQGPPLHGGRMQLLAKARTDAGGQLFLDFIPHYYKPKATLRPRDPLQKQLDGRLFEQLALRMPAPRRQVIVLGLHRERQPEDEQSADKEDATFDLPSSSEKREQGGEGASGESEDAEEPQKGSETDESTEKDSQEAGKKEEPKFKRVTDPLNLPAHMGRALLAGRRFGHPRQRLVLIEVRPISE